MYVWRTTQVFISLASRKVIIRFVKHLYTHRLVQYFLLPKSSWEILCRHSISRLFSLSFPRLSPPRDNFLASHSHWPKIKGTKIFSAWLLRMRRTAAGRDVLARAWLSRQLFLGTVGNVYLIILCIMTIRVRKADWSIKWCCRLFWHRSSYKHRMPQEGKHWYVKRDESDKRSRLRATAWERPALFENTRSILRAARIISPTRIFARNNHAWLSLLFLH